MRHTPVLRAPHQNIYRFANGYGASVITNWQAYGGRELAVIQFDSEDADRFKLVYDTPVTNNVVGSVSDQQLRELLDEIEALPWAGRAQGARRRR